MAAPRRKPNALTHIDTSGRPRMVDVSAKPATAREAIAAGSVYMAAATLALVTSGKAAKGDVLTTAQLAGIMAAKRTHELIPLCHPLPLTGIDVSLAPDMKRSAIDITATVRTTAQTGVEMEALTAVTVAALTVYDMLKAAQKDIRIGDIRLVRKRGGKSGDVELEANPTDDLDTLALQTGDRIVDCRGKVRDFCRRDFSYKSYDSVAVPLDNTIREDEIRLANRMVARMGESVVFQFLDQASCVGKVLARIPAQRQIWDESDDEIWAALSDLLRCVVGPGIGLPRATKVLHKKRPNLIPILDGVVMKYAEKAARAKGQILPSDIPERGAAAIRVLREDVVRNLPLLTDLGRETKLSPVRVLDILVWAWEGGYQPIWAR